ncbi:hypothetical protein ACFSQ0_07355 [Mesonia sediminis]|uniref:Uncharacterized protein n=1 Tax=Mesonia sediminis TaxID=1703946 RepID=A0ABW5SGT4_9FLAO
MKNLKLSLHFLIALFVSAVIFTGCSVDNEQIEEEVAIDEKSLNESLTSYQNYTESENRTAEIDGYLVREVFVGDEEIASRYIFESTQVEETGTYVDVDRENFTLTVTDIETAEQVVYNEINQFYEYGPTDQFDIIRIIINPTFPDPITGEPQPVTLGWRYSYGSCVNGVRGVYRAYYILGFKITKEERVMDKNNPNKQETVGCNEEYQP